jgi:hypothetical protein
MAKSRDKRGREDKKKKKAKKVALPPSQGGGLSFTPRQPGTGPVPGSPQP